MTPEEQAIVEAVSEKLAPLRYVLKHELSFSRAPYYIWDRVNYRAVWEGWTLAIAIAVCDDLNLPRP